MREGGREGGIATVYVDGRNKRYIITPLITAYNMIESTMIKMRNEKA